MSGRRPPTALLVSKLGLIAAIRRNLATKSTLAAAFLLAMTTLLSSLIAGQSVALERPDGQASASAAAFQDECLISNDFEDDTLGGWTNQNTSVFETRAGGPATSRFYVHTKDGSGASTIQSPDTYVGDWIEITGGCGTLCYDVNLFNDGEPGSPGIAANFYLYSGTSVAQFLAHTISEPGGPNPGWHRICAPVRMADGNALPSSADGQWRVNGETSGLAAVAAWNAIVQNVTAVRFPVDWGSSSQNEEVGYDNVCLSEAECPTPTPTVGPTPTITGVIRTERGCIEDPLGVAYQQGETVPIQLRIEGVSQATVRVMYEWPAGGQERQIDGGTINGATDYLVSPPLVIPGDAAIGARRVSLQVRQDDENYREIALCGFDVTAVGTPTPTPTGTHLPPSDAALAGGSPTGSAGAQLAAGAEPTPGGEHHGSRERLGHRFGAGPVRRMLGAGDHQDTDP
jgi:hypothetical protein